jgi:3-hydroxyacyl-[acyl-carrier-protein] dehydratase
MRFLLIDCVRDFEPGRRLLAVKNVTLESPYFVDHFPGQPVFPGALLLEAMAQASGCLLERTLWELEQRRVLPLRAGRGGRPRRRKPPKRVPLGGVSIFQMPPSPP